MAATIATATGRDKSRTKEDHRLGSESATDSLAHDLREYAYSVR